MAQQWDPYIANYGKKWSQIDPHLKRRMAPHQGSQVTSHQQQQMLFHDVVPPWLSTGPQGTGYKRPRAKALEELERVQMEAYPWLFEGIGTLQPTLATNVSPTLSPGPTTDASTFQADAQQLSTSFGIPIQQAIISLAKSRGLDPDQYLNTPDASTFLADAQQLSTSSGIPIQQAIISLAASRGLDPNQFLNVASVGIGSIAPASTTPPLTAPAPTGGFFPKNVILDAITGSGVLPST